MHLLKKENQSGKVNSMNLYLVHSGYYDKENSEGFYEQHSNILIIAKSIYNAKEKIKKNKEFLKKKMHIDGIKEINIVDGYEIKPIKSNSIKEVDVKTYTHHQITFLKKT